MRRVARHPSPARTTAPLRIPGPKEHTLSPVALHYSSPTVTVCTSAFAVEGQTGGLASVPTGHLVHLAEDALGLTAGHYQAGHYQGHPANGQRTLFLLSGDEATGSMNKGATISKATVAPDWRHPFAIAVPGMRLSELRTFLTENPDLPDDALVLIGPATHPLDVEDAPAERGLDVGAYVPAMNAGGNYGQFWHPEHSETPRPELSIPAVLLSQSV
ncbi:MULTISPECIES: hypothetical protein [Streptomyces]|uniref:hypothetical protein n=1 Tax=Streptomyces TaxID=1883 RepID=UPI001F0965BE|nr:MULTISPECIES: hypothetical protein [Streptomyces]MDX3066389.1 hypothetical protein [Streptomyces sp. ND04-05B]MDX3519449.1 hypothetical protein [Streptomyces scabiei]